MNSLIIYDSGYGNTKLIVDAIAASAKRFGTVIARKASDITKNDLTRADLIYIGSPTQGGKPMGTLDEFLESLPSKNMKQMDFAVFDTRFAIDKHGLGLKLLMKTIGFAAPKLAATIRDKGGRVVAPPEGFIVNDKKGPLAKGEIERAATWARDIIGKVKAAE